MKRKRKRKRWGIALEEILNKEEILNLTRRII